MAIRAQNKPAIVVASLLLGTFGAHAAYKAHAKDIADDPSAARTAAAQIRAAPVRTDGGVRVSALLDRTAVLQDKDGLVHLELTFNVPMAERRSRRNPADVVVVIDHSTSMSGEKLAYAKQALRGLIDRLGITDRFGLVGYGSSARTLVPLTEADGHARPGFRSAVDAIEPDGGTNISAGLDEGRSLLSTRSDKRPARLLLFSDGQANQGDRSIDGLAQRARRVLDQDAVVSAFGIGQGFDESVMTSIASAGAGSFYYLAKLEMIPTLLDDEFEAAKEAYATRAELRIRLGDGMRLHAAGGASVLREGDETVVPLGTLRENQPRKLWLTLHVPTRALRDNSVDRVAVRYRRGDKTYETVAAALPPIATVADPALFQERIATPVWERAMLEEEINRTREELGDAIASGTAADVDKSVARVETERALASSLGSKKVLTGLSELGERAAQAKASQQAAPELRNLAAKREKAIGFSRRNANQVSRHWDAAF